jgi:hypothetical protein
MYKNTDWNKFGDIIDSYINLTLKLKEQNEIDEAVQQWTTIIQSAAWHATPGINTKLQLTHNVPLQVTLHYITLHYGRRKVQEICIQRI